jgi:hypothetical protein
MIQPDVSVVFLDLGLNETPGLTNADITMFAADALDPSCFQAKVVLNGLKEISDLPRLETYSFGVMSR